MEVGGEKIRCRLLQSDGTDILPKPPAWIEPESSATTTVRVANRPRVLMAFESFGCISSPPFGWRNQLRHCSNLERGVFQSGAGVGLNLILLPMVYA
jgi:hypothetical protein